MSETAKAAEVAVKEPKEPLFSKKNKALITDPLNDDNPITIQVLGICSALAITVQVKQAFVMAMSVLVVLVGANLIVSLMRNLIPSRVRIIVQLVIVAALVILVDQVLKAFVYDVSKQLSVFVGLIITNCIIMGRLEAFALANKPWPSFLDAVGNAAGYGWILIVVAIAREFFGSGKIWGVQLIPDAFYDLGYANNGLMILPPMALITVGIIIWVQRARNTKLIED
ncbi:MAG: NADH:ubiquinone reductase (Na(+)-transporting) subunit D [Bacteroidetes bacterium]|nr:MAG: NADH:ubiquinone reductase (Na(+)-transporting) subunit D [Bacteroidota bacterium]MBL1144578.1 NADH:ubiquinone reductase (Na(+)-transporting) subunit D [Bacteroidota bacterium]MCB0803383.1 NADH:ubiquinone reductase (Na(+)-transporting) subunit D [Flavobacteriales bacterium]NOG57373.1 NADH:ubiquinone reductase (Na(+)-transporting) subunit D [Bacteroidota bacterium]